MLSTTFSIASQCADISILIFHATSLAAAKTFQLFLDTHRDHSLTASEVSAIDRSFNSLGQSINLSAIQNAVYLGRTRPNRRIPLPFSDEPCFYLVLPHLTYYRRHWVETLLQKVVAPAFKRALEEYEVPEIPEGAKRAAPPIFRDLRMLLAIPKYYEVMAHSEDYWERGEPRQKSMDVTRSRILELAWRYMQEIVGESVEAALFAMQDMKLVILVPRVDHQVARDSNGPYNRVGDFDAAVREVMSLYSDDLDPKFLEGAKVVFTGEYDMNKSEGGMDY